MASFTYDAVAGRYRDAAGRFVSQATVRVGVDALADLASERMAALSQRLLAGQLALADWQAQMAAEIKTAHIAAGVAAYGGTAQMSPARYGYLGSAVKDDYARLRDFAAQIADGSMPLDGRLVARSRLYGQAARVLFSDVTAREQRLRGVDQERNVLGGDHHCAQCAGLPHDWVAAGTLPPVGSRACGPNDRCRLEYRRSA